LHLLKRSESDSILAENLGRRKDIPRHVFQQLIAKASEDVRKRLESERPEFRGEIQNAVTDVTGALHAKFGPASKDYFAAKRIVGAQHRAGQLREQKLLEYAQARKFYECVVALSLMCALPVDVAERALVEESREALLIIAKSLDLSWTTTMSLLFLGATNHQISGRDLDLMSEKFVLLSVETSLKIMEVYRMRKAKAAECSEFQRLPQLHAS
jgi:hypothetical protein